MTLKTMRAAAASKSTPHIDRIPVTIVTGESEVAKATMVRRFIGLHKGSNHQQCQLRIYEQQDATADARTALNDIFDGTVNDAIRYWTPDDDVGSMSEHGAKDGCAESSLDADAVVLVAHPDADPLVLIHMFFREDSVQMRFRLDAVLAVIDTTNSLSVKGDYFTRRHILLADRIIVFNQQLAPEEADAKNRHALQAELSQLKPTGTCFFYWQHEGKIHQETFEDSFLDLDLYELDTICQNIPELIRELKREYQSSLSPSSTTVFIEIPGEFHINRLTKWIESFLTEQEQDIVHPPALRYQGIFAVKGKDDKYVFHGVGHLWSGGYSPSFRWNFEKQTNLLLITGEGLDKAKIMDELRECLVVNAPLRFAIGEAVQAKVRQSWEPGRIVKHWDNGNAYRIRLKKGEREVWAPHDTECFVRKKPKHQTGKKCSQMTRRMRRHA